MGFSCRARVPFHNSQTQLSELVKRLDLGDGNVDKKREIITRIRRRPHHFQSRCRERLAQLEQRERLKSSEIEAEEARLAAECRALEAKIATLDGLNSATTEAIR